jgi:flavin reductase (DIM6/NTAB) family NADH-FMN oxidoreductase RutF
MEGVMHPIMETQSFKDVLSHWATGVTVVTTRRAATPVGMTVSSFTGVSLHPAQILICVNQQAQTHAALVESGFFAVNLLAAHQVEWGMRFAGLQPAVNDRFAEIAWTTAQTGAPILPCVLGWLDCRISQSFFASDHTIFLGTVVACALCTANSPLLYYHRSWRSLADGAL